MNEVIVRFDHVTKRFGSVTALDEVSFSIGLSSIIGLVGANGSGKSTLLRHMVGLYLPDDGSVSTFNCDAAKLTSRRLGRVGYVHQEGKLLEWMTVEQHIRYVAAYYEHWNGDLERRYIRDFDIEMQTRVGALSPGQRQKLAILLAIGHEPQLLILDEPASALDPIARGRFLDLVMSLIQDQNRTIIISSHILSDIEKVIDHVMIMDRGRLLRDCSFDDLREEFCKIRLTSLNGELPELKFDGLVDKQQSGSQAILLAPSAVEPQIEQTARRINCRMEKEHLSLEEIYKIIVR